MSYRSFVPLQPLDLRTVPGRDTGGVFPVDDERCRTAADTDARLDLPGHTDQKLAGRSAWFGLVTSFGRQADLRPIRLGDEAHLVHLAGGQVDDLRLSRDSG